MPTGYTAIIDDKPDVTFRDFALRCARAFGATIHQREDSLDAELEEPRYDNHYELALARAEAELDGIRSLSDAECDAFAAREYGAAVSSHRADRDRNRAVRDRYAEIKAFVNVWEPPTGDHARLKTFMLEQLETGCPGDYYERNHPEPRTGAQWRRDKIQILNRVIADHKESVEKAVARHRAACSWIKALRDSLEVSR